MGAQHSKIYDRVDNYLVSEDEEEMEMLDFADGLKALPYSAHIEQRLPFSDVKLNRLIPACSLKLSIKEAYEENKQLWYRINIEHGCFHWSLTRRFHDFKSFHEKLKTHRTILNMQLPEIKLEMDRETRRSSIVIRRKKVPKVPHFPLNSQAFSRRTDLEFKMATLENYMVNVVKIPCFRDYHETLEFLEIGPFSFIKEFGLKEKEGFVERRIFDNIFGVCCGFCCGFWKKRWLFLKENFLGVIRPSDGEVECVLLLDSNFKTITGKKNVLIIQNLTRKLYIRCENNTKVLEFSDSICLAMEKGISDFVTPNRFGSFTRPRAPTKCKWIIDGATYFEAVALAMEAAKEEIFIADWWLSPEIYLIRPTTRGHYWRLDYLLRRKAEEGIRIYVLLYKEIPATLKIDSEKAAKKLSNLHPNIQVMQHPSISKGALLWANHEKILCVDQKRAFVGGLDLCYGRWDDYQHRLVDIGDAAETKKVRRHKSTSDKSSSSILSARRASSLPDITKAFQNVEQEKHRKIFLNPEQPADHHRAIREEMLKQLDLMKFPLWPDKDFSNCFKHDDLDSGIINRSTTPRLPWHDIGLYVEGRAACDIARHFILRWNHAKKNFQKDVSKLMLMPKSISNIEMNSLPIIQKKLGTLYTAQAQVIRSLSSWSGGICNTENSIHSAYKKIIKEAKRYIYIENQYFISQPSGNSGVLNQVSDILFNRIVKAHRYQQQFRVYIILPLLPAFEGEIGTNSGTLIETVLRWNQKSIGHGVTSLMQRLARQMKDPTEYIGFYGLRTHGTLADKLVSELVYVHSKIMIVDDEIAIIGSANINDRSLLGSRDSEIAVIIKDKNFFEKNAGHFSYSLRTALFREHLGVMKNSDSEIDVRNPSTLEFFKEWNRIAIHNTSIYEEVFHAVPNDLVATFEDISTLSSVTPLATKDPTAAKKKLKTIQGHIVMFPQKFLVDEKLSPNISTKENLLPQSTFT